MVATYVPPDQSHGILAVNSFCLFGTGETVVASANVVSAGCGLLGMDGIACSFRAITTIEEAQ